MSSACLHSWVTGIKGKAEKPSRAWGVQVTKAKGNNRYKPSQEPGTLPVNAYLGCKCVTVYTAAKDPFLFLPPTGESIPAILEKTKVLSRPRTLLDFGLLNFGEFPLGEILRSRWHLFSLLGSVLLLHPFAFGRVGASLKDRRLKGSELS